MPNFEQLLESSLFGAQEELPHIERNKRTRLEKALRVARERTRSLSGMGEQYSHALSREKRILIQVAKYRPLTKYENLVLNNPTGAHE